MSRTLLHVAWGLVALLATLSPPAHARATGTLSGVVLESDGVTTIIGANVRIEGTTLGAVTDIDGKYRIIGIPAGTYTVTASYTGYTPQAINGVEMQDGYTRELNFTLSAGTELGEVSVVAYQPPLITNDAVGQARVATGENLENLPLRGVAATVGLQGGIVNRDPSSELNIRGGRAEEVQYIVDGVRVTAPPLGTLHQERTERDRLTGAIPARYSDAPAEPEPFWPEWPAAASYTPPPAAAPPAAYDPYSGEDYSAFEEVGFRRPEAAALSTFSIDVDRASYANVRRMLNDGYLPPPAAVRIEEFVNAFELDMDGPTDNDPFAVHTEVGPCPWAPDHQLVRIGIQGRRLALESLPPANLVFLLDVSGSMGSPDKLPLLVTAFERLVDQLRPQDRVSIVVYAGAAGLVLPPTSGADKRTILDALGRLQAGGSTAGAEGIQLAYDVARQNFDPAATNRVLLATDGDFNVGITGEGALQELIERERASGVFLSVFGLGTGNLQDGRMESLAAWGNGAYGYLDSVREAERVFVSEIGGTLFAIAKDVKVQVEFNPVTVAGYRLVGYDNRRLPDEAFADDTRDAAELGAGHHVTALYEIVPAGADESALPPAQRLRYQRADDRGSDDLLTVQLRYKPATGPGTFASRSVLRTVPVAAPDDNAASPTEAMTWTTAVAEAGLVLRASEYAPGATIDAALGRARLALGDDPEGDRAEFIRLMERASELVERQSQPVP